MFRRNHRKLFALTLLGLSLVAGLTPARLRQPGVRAAAKPVAILNDL